MVITGSYFRQLDGLRFLAMLLVLLSHWSPGDFLGYDLQLGRIGVDLFFVLSGFLITRNLTRYKSQIKEGSLSILGGYKYFYIRRSLRIFPVYFFVVGLLLLFNTGHIRDTAVYHLTFTTNFLIYFQDAWLGNLTPLWSLSVEEQFYLIWPLVLFTVPVKRLPIAFVIIVILGVFFRMQFWHFPGGGDFIPTYVLMPACIDLFALGGILAWLYEFKKSALSTILKSKWNILLIPLFIFGPLSIQEFILYFNNFYFLIIFRFVSGLAFFWLIGKALFGFEGIAGKILSNKVVVHMGKLSYSMYLFHNFIPGFYLGLPWPESEWLRMPIYFISLLILSHFTWLLIETPFQRLKKHFA